jgi:hypothetical protein
VAAQSLSANLSTVSGQIGCQAPSAGAEALRKLPEKWAQLCPVRPPLSKAAADADHRGEGPSRFTRKVTTMVVIEAQCPELAQAAVVGTCHHVVTFCSRAAAGPGDARKCAPPV